MSREIAKELLGCHSWFRVQFVLGGVRCNRSENTNSRTTNKTYTGKIAIKTNQRFQRDAIWKPLNT